MKDIDEAVSNLESRLNIRTGFFDALLKEDDWSFVIKAHALIEASVSSYLASSLGRKNLIGCFSRLELSNKSFGKLAFIKELNLLTKHERRFIASLSELRNKLVHNISEVEFDFNNYFEKLKRDQKKNFIDSFGYCYLAGEKNGTCVVGNIEKIKLNLKKTIWSSLKYVLAIIEAIMRADEYKSKTGILERENYLLQKTILKKHKNTK